MEIQKGSYLFARNCVLKTSIILVLCDFSFPTPCYIAQVRVLEFGARSSIANLTSLLKLS